MKQTFTCRIRHGIIRPHEQRSEFKMVTNLDHVSQSAILMGLPLQLAMQAGGHLKQIFVFRDKLLSSGNMSSTSSPTGRRAHSRAPKLCESQTAGRTFPSGSPRRSSLEGTETVGTSAFCGNVMDSLASRAEFESEGHGTQGRNKIGARGAGFGGVAGGGFEEETNRRQSLGGLGSEWGSGGGLGSILGLGSVGFADVKEVSPASPRECITVLIAMLEVNAMLCGIPPPTSLDCRGEKRFVCVIHSCRPPVVNQAWQSLIFVGLIDG